MRIPCAAIVIALFASTPLCAAPNANKLPAHCDRACLGDLLAQYMKDVIAHDPGALPVSSNVRFTQNGEVTKLGAGLWRTAFGLGAYEQEILDVPGHTAAAQAVVLEDGGKPALFALRLKEHRGRIGQIETMVARPGKSSVIFGPAGFEKGNGEMAYVPPSSEVDSRAQAIRIAMKYPQGLKAGSFGG